MIRAKVVIDNEGLRAAARRYCRYLREDMAIFISGELGFLDDENHDQDNLRRLNQFHVDLTASQLIKLLFKLRKFHAAAIVKRLIDGR